MAFCLRGNTIKGLNGFYIISHAVKIYNLLVSTKKHLDFFVFLNKPPYLKER